MAILTTPISLPSPLLKPIHDVQLVLNTKTRFANTKHFVNYIIFVNLFLVKNRYNCTNVHTCKQFIKKKTYWKVKIWTKIRWHIMTYLDWIWNLCTSGFKLISLLSTQPFRYYLLSLSMSWITCLVASYEFSNFFHNFVFFSNIRPQKILRLNLLQWTAS